MIQSQLAPVVETVLRRAERQGYIVPRDVREELTRAGLQEIQWKDVLGEARGSLHYRQGRYYFIQAVSPRVQEQQSQQQIVFHTIRNLIRKRRVARSGGDRRKQDRIDFIHPVKVTTEDGRVLNVLTRDLSPTGMRLLGNRSLLGQKIKVSLTPVGETRSCHFSVRILWSCAVADDLYENGGAFLGMAQN